MTKEQRPLVGIIMGSKSDWDTMAHAHEMLDRFGVAHECRVVSAHRTPEWMCEYAREAESRGLQVIIAGAGGAAHLPGMVAAQTILPVLGVPVQSQSLQGLDSLLSIVQMPGGVPVATLAIGKAGAVNAALLAVSILARGQGELVDKLRAVSRRAAAQGARRDPAVNGVILPGATIGVLGSGQLGRMFAIAARRMGYRVHTFSPDYDTPTGQVADKETQAAYEDLDAVREFARGVDVVTFEFENIPAAAVEAAASFAPVRPDGAVLVTTQNRLREKMFLASAGFPVAPFRAVRSLAELNEALADLGPPAVLKTAGWGYDGKGQVKDLHACRRPGCLAGGGHNRGRGRKVRRLRVRGLGGRGPLARRRSCRVRHDRQCTRQSHSRRVGAPAGIPPSVAREAVAMARAVLESLEVVGVLCVEFFVTRQGGLVINELAPRPHNSGHLTFDACITSQFEQQLRAVCGLALGSTELVRPAAMANLLGDLWQSGVPNWAAACRFEEVKLHLYGKETPRPGRKMGHLTVLSESAERARETVLAARGARRRSFLNGWRGASMPLICIHHFRVRTTEEFARA